jgi:hypothetical protein
MWLKSCIFLLDRQQSGMLLGLVSRRHTLHNAGGVYVHDIWFNYSETSYSYVEHFYVFCVAYVSSASYQPTNNLKKVKK